MLLKMYTNFHFNIITLLQTLVQSPNEAWFNVIVIHMCLMFRRFFVPYFDIER